MASMPTTALVLFTVALLSAPSSPAVEKADYSKDLAAFFDEMDRTYPFFDLKGIRKEWAVTKVRLAARVRTCSSDAQFLGLLLEAMRSLRDGHMGIVKSNAKLPAAEPEYYPGLSFLPATRNRVVVMAGAGGLAKQIPPGTVVTHIDRKPARAYLEAKAKKAWSEGGHFSSPQRARLFEYRIPLRGKRGEAHALTILKGRRRRTVRLVSTFEARGWPHTYNMPEDLTRHGRSCLYGKLPSGVGYIYLRRIDRSTEPGIAAALAAHDDARGWIVDLRGNGGGGYGPDLIRRLSTLARPTAVLLDAGCVSAGETLARDIVHQTQGRLFGSTTAGSSSAKRTWTFPSGIATIVVPTRSRWGINRKPIEFNGIEPHEKVEAEPDEVARGQNSCILRATKFLLEHGASRRRK